MKGHRYVGNDCRQLFRQYRHVLTVAHFFTQRPFYFIGIGKNVLQVVILRQQLGSGLFAYAGYAGYIIHRIAHQPQHIYYLVYPLYVPFGAYFLRPHCFLLAECGFGLVDKYTLTNDLPVILIGRHHIYRIAQVGSLYRQRTDYIIGLKAIQLQARQVKALYYALDVRQ